MSDLDFDIHGIPVRVTTDSPAVAAAAQTYLRPFAVPDTFAPAAVTLDYRAAARAADIPLALPAGAAPRFSSQTAGRDHPLRNDWAWQVYRDGPHTLADFPARGRLHFDYTANRVEAYLIAPEELHTDLCAWFVHLGLAEMLKPHGLYAVHAAGLEKDGRGLLMPGSSGRGKTTCCVSLLRRGYRCLSDDYPILRAADRLELLPFPMKIDVTDRTIGFFPELRAAADTLRVGLSKRSFPAERFYPQGFAPACPPALLLFPRIVDWPKSYVEPLPKSRALEELLPQSLLALNPEQTRRQFHALARLVEETPCYRLHSGADVEHVADLIDPLLAAAPAADAAQPARVSA